MLATTLEKVMNSPNRHLHPQCTQLDAPAGAELVFFTIKEQSINHNATMSDKDQFHTLYYNLSYPCSIQKANVHISKIGSYHSNLYLSLVISTIK